MLGINTKLLINCSTQQLLAELSAGTPYQHQFVTSNSKVPKLRLSSSPSLDLICGLQMSALLPFPPHTISFIRLETPFLQVGIHTAPEGKSGYLLLLNVMCK